MKRNAGVAGSIFAIALAASLTLAPHLARAQFTYSGSGGAAAANLNGHATLGARRTMRFAIVAPLDTAYLETSSAVTTYGGGTRNANPLSTRAGLQLALIATASSTDGFLTSSPITRSGWSPSTVTVVRPSSVTSIVQWFTIDSNTGTCGPGAGVGQVTAATSVACATDQMAGIVHDTRSALSSTHWLCCSGDGTTQSCLDTGVTATNGTDYQLRIDLSSSAVSCTINGSSTSKATNVPAAAVDLKLNWGAMNLIASLQTGPTFSAVTLQNPF